MPLPGGPSRSVKTPGSRTPDAPSTMGSRVRSAEKARRGESSDGRLRWPTSTSALTERFRNRSVTVGASTPARCRRARPSSNRPSSSAPGIFSANEAAIARFRSPAGVAGFMVAGRDAISRSTG